MKKIKFILLFTVVGFLLVSVLIFPSSCAKGVNQGLLFSSEILIPSLFPFMFLSAFIVESGLSARIGKFLNRTTKFLFNLPGSTAATILISFIGGYPTGARGVKSLLERKEITLAEANQMLCFAVGAGPAFIISVVGSGLLGSNKTGLVLFIAQVVASLTIGIALGQYKRIFSVSSKTPHRKYALKPPSVSNALVHSCIDSTYGMINMCAFVVLFSALLMIINDSGVHKWFINLLILCHVPENIAASILPILLEVTGGCSNAARLSNSAELISFALGWAGACVHFQICASLEDISFSRVKFTLYRFMNGVLSAAFTHLGLLIFPQVQSTAVDLSCFNSGVLFYSSNAIASFALLVLCAFFLYSMPGWYPKHSDVTFS